MKEKMIIALDISSRERALHLVRELHDLAGMFKVGSQLYTAAGPEIVREIVDMGGRVFLDLKFHDIPNTVTRAAVEAAKLGVLMMTLHASGGRAMMESVVGELHEKLASKRPRVVAVTILTSLDTPALFELGLEQPVEVQVERLALLPGLRRGRHCLFPAGNSALTKNRRCELQNHHSGNPHARPIPQ